MTKKSSSARVTSPRVAKQASSILRSGRTSSTSKSVAASALSQARARRGK